MRHRVTAGLVLSTALVMGLASAAGATLDDPPQPPPPPNTQWLVDEATYLATDTEGWLSDTHCVDTAWFVTSEVLATYLDFRKCFFIVKKP